MIPNDSILIIIVVHAFTPKLTAGGTFEPETLKQLKKRKKLLAERYAGAFCC